MLQFMLFGIVGGNEWIWLVLIAVILLFGARKIPDLARSIGRARGEFEKGRQESEEEIKKDSRDNIKETYREKMEKAAKSLGIDFEGLSDEDLTDALKKALEKSKSSQ